MLMRFVPYSLSGSSAQNSTQQIRGRNAGEPEPAAVALPSEQSGQPVRESIVVHGRRLHLSEVQ